MTLCERVRPTLPVQDGLNTHVYVRITNARLPDHSTCAEREAAARFQ